jgi:hypothetical protein
MGRGQGPPFRRRQTSRVETPGTETTIPRALFVPFGGLRTIAKAARDGVGRGELEAAREADGQTSRAEDIEVGPRRATARGPRGSARARRGAEQGPPCSS